MKIFCIGSDDSAFEKNSALRKRLKDLSGLIEKYDIIESGKIHGKEAIAENMTAYGVNAKGFLNKILSFFRIYFLSKKLLAQGKYDVITVQDQYYLGLIGWLLARKFKIGLEIQVHGFEKYGGLRKLIAKFVLPRAGAIRAVSERLKKFLVEEFKVKEERITVVPIFVDLKQNAKIKNQNDNFKCKNINKFVFLTVSRLVAVKNIEMQIKALANIIKQYPNIELWIVGDGEEKEKLQDLCYVLCVMCYAKFLGWQNDLSKYYEQADVFLLTSNSEGWGMAAIEAASYGLPIIMTDVGCAGEAIVDGKSGIVIPDSDQSKLEENMVKLINNTELRKKLGEGARKAANNLLNLENTLKLYKSSWTNAEKNAK